MSSLIIPSAEVNTSGLDRAQSNMLSNYKVTLNYARLYVGEMDRVKNKFDKLYYYEQIAGYLASAERYLASLKDSVPSWEGRIEYGEPLEVKKP